MFIIYGSSTALNRSLLLSCTLVFLNSFLNPAIYRWKMRPIQNAVMNVHKHFLVEKSFIALIVAEAVHVQCLDSVFSYKYAWSA